MDELISPLKLERLKAAAYKQKRTRDAAAAGAAAGGTPGQPELVFDLTGLHREAATDGAEDERPKKMPRGAMPWRDGKFIAQHGSGINQTCHNCHNGMSKRTRVGALARQDVLCCLHVALPVALGPGATCLLSDLLLQAKAMIVASCCTVSKPDASYPHRTKAYNLCWFTVQGMWPAAMRSAAQSSKAPGPRHGVLPASLSS